MHSVMRIAVSMCLLVSVLGNGHHSGAKLRRDGVLNLYPFPRVGRASHRTWQIPLNEYYSVEPVDKRQLYAFPRVGRSGMSLVSEPRAEQFQPIPAQRDSSSMWFGPRLGRSKSEDDDTVVQNVLNERSEPEQMESIQEERKKRQTKLYY